MRTVHATWFPTVDSKSGNKRRSGAGPRQASTVVVGSNSDAAAEHVFCSWEESVARRSLGSRVFAEKCAETELRCPANNSAAISSRVTSPVAADAATPFARSVTPLGHSCRVRSAEYRTDGVG